MDDILSFAAHATTIAAKTTNTAGALTRLMPNVGGPSACKRRMLRSVVESVLLYAAPVWRGGARREVNPEVHGVCSGERSA